MKKIPGVHIGSVPAQVIDASNENYDARLGCMSGDIVRIYDPVLGGFLSADSVLPDGFDMQAFNRYSYVVNNPLKYTDSTGHKPGNAHDPEDTEDEFDDSEEELEEICACDGRDPGVEIDSFLDDFSEDDEETWNEIGDEEEIDSGTRRVTTSSSSSDVRTNLTKAEIKKIEKLKAKFLKSLEKRRALIQKALNGNKSALRKINRLYNTTNRSQLLKVAHKLAEARNAVTSGRIKFGMLTDSYLERSRAAAGIKPGDDRRIGAATNAETGFIYFNPREMNARVLAHEIGHIIGLGDFAGPSGEYYGYDEARADAEINGFDSAIQRASNLGCLIVGNGGDGCF